MDTVTPKGPPSPYADHEPAELPAGGWAWLAEGDGRAVLPVELGRQLDPAFGPRGVSAVRYPTREAAVTALHAAVGAAEADRR
jgi:hypothetical protein